VESHLLVDEEALCKALIEGVYTRPLEIAYRLWIGSNRLGTQLTFGEVIPCLVHFPFHLSGIRLRLAKGEGDVSGKIFALIARRLD
jgi:hypothetical protein